MAAVLSTRQKTLNRTAVALVVLLTLVYLVPIYWITSTAFKPRSLATTVPPTVLFEPEVTAFIPSASAVPACCCTFIKAWPCEVQNSATAFE